MKELSKEDQERIEKAAKSNALKLTDPEYVEGGSIKICFMQGAEYEHPIAFEKGKIEGFNEGIEAVIKHIWGEGAIIKEIEKLKKPL